MTVLPSPVRRVLVPFVAVVSLLLVLPLLFGVAMVGAVLVLTATFVLSRPLVRRLLVARPRRAPVRSDFPPSSEVIDTTWTRVR